MDSDFFVPDDSARLLARSGRDGLVSLLRDFEQKGVARHVMLPAHAPEGLVAPFLRQGWRITLYPLAADLSPTSTLISRLAEPDVGLVILVHFFGLSFDFKALKVTSSVQGVQVLEDFSHFWPEEHALDKVQDEIAYTLVSLPKLIGVSDGAVLTAPVGKEITRHLRPEDRFYSFCAERALRIGFRPPPTNRAKQLGLRITGRLLDPYRRLQKSFINPRSMSQTTRKKISNARLQEMMQARAAHWERYRQGLPAHLLAGLDHSRSGNGLAFGFPLLIDHADLITEKLKAVGIAPVRLVRRWDFRELSEDPVARASASKILERHIILPLQEYLKPQDIDTVIDQITQVAPS